MERDNEYLEIVAVFLAMVLFILYLSYLIYSTASANNLIRATVQIKPNQPIISGEIPEPAHTEFYQNVIPANKLQGGAK